MRYSGFPSNLEHAPSRKCQCPGIRHGVLRVCGIQDKFGVGARGNALGGGGGDSESSAYYSTMKAEFVAPCIADRWCLSNECIIIVDVTSLRDRSFALKGLQREKHLHDVRQQHAPSAMVNPVQKKKKKHTRRFRTDIRHPYRVLVGMYKLASATRDNV